ncbi:unnamed protein product [marine sediment metagenome]|uniref:Uncharacterized protein n=1 Tax=marine sediment metagenome TaxID=412755 RepID=X1C847_9ZZZZ
MQAIKTGLIETFLVAGAAIESPGTVVSNPAFFAIIFSAKVWGIDSPYQL